jgi:hypothetical protein
MGEPEIVIVIERGIVSAVATAGSGLRYRVIDIDNIKSGDVGTPTYTDYVPDAENVDIEQYTRDILKDV